jgi:hypothetical protein
MKKILSDLAVYLNNEGYTTQEVPASEQAPADQLFVQLNPDPLDWDLHAELAFIGDLDPEKNLDGNKEGENQIDYLQYFVLLPIVCPLEKAGDMSRLVTLANNALPLVGFSISENQGWVFFRHLMLCIDGKIDHRIVSETLMTMEYLIGTFGNALEDLASGTKTFDQILADDIQWQ